MIRPTGRFLLKAALVVAIIVIGASAAILLRLASAPLSLASFAPLARQALTFGEAGYQADFDDLVLTWGGWGRGLDIRAVGFRLYERSGAQVGAIPEVSVELSAAALFDGRLAPRELTVRGPTARLLRTEEGRVMLGATVPGEPAQPPGSTRLLAALLSILSQHPAPGSTGAYLERIRVADGDFLLYDQQSDTLWRLPDAAVELRRDAAGLSGTVSGHLGVLGQLWRIEAEIGYQARTENTRIRIGFFDVVPAAFAGVKGLLGQLAPLDAPLTGTLGLTLSPDGVVENIDIDVSVAEGRLNLPAVYPEPVPVDGASLRARFDKAAVELAVDALYVRFGRGAVEGEGRVTFGADGTGIRFYGQFQDLTVADVHRYWPLPLAPNARRWVAANIRSGRFPEGSVQVDIKPGMLKVRPLPADTIDVRFRGTDLVARFVKAFPLLEDAHGFGRLTNGFLDVEVERGHVAGLTIEGGRIFLDKINRRGKATADISLTVSGSLAESLRMLDYPPLEFMTRVGIDPADAGGHAETRARFRFPLVPRLTFEQVWFEADARVSDASIANLLKSFRIDGGDLRVRATHRRLAASGEIRLNDVPFALSWDEDFTNRQGSSSRYRLAATLGEGDLDRLGLPGAGYVRGPIDAVLTVTGRGRRVDEGLMRFDLSGADVTVHELGWMKPVGAPARLEVPLRSDGDRLRADHFRLIAPDLEADGQFVLGPDEGLESFAIDHLKHGRTELSARAERGADGVLAITLDGPSFDIRPLIRSLLVPSALRASPPDFDAQVSFETVIAEGDVEIGNFSAQASYHQDRWRAARAEAEFEDGAPLSFVMTSEGDTRSLEIRSTDAGRVARALGIYDNGIGGELTLTARIDDTVAGSPMEGELLVKGFRVVNAPVLARILTLGSLTGIGELLNGEGITFRKLKIPFTLKDGLLRTRKARAHGPALGITVEGWVDNRRSTIEMRGTVIPAYTLNTILRSLPIVGTILTGPKGEGLFAFTYKVSGARDAPEISVNPLSGLAPGILRSLFGGSVPEPERPAEGETADDKIDGAVPSEPDAVAPAEDAPDSVVPADPAPPPPPDETEPASEPETPAPAAPDDG